MTLGTSLLLITLLIFSVLGIRYITREKKWRLVVKIAGCLVLLGVIIGLVIWAWSSRLQPADTLGSLSLGMSPLEVSLAVGKPDIESVPKEIDGSRRYLYYRDYNGYSSLDYVVIFSNVNESPSEKVELICTNVPWHEVFGLGVSSSEEEVKKKLGEPTNQSIRQDGLAKMISYEKWKVAFEVEKKRVVGVCISSSGKAGYLEEYGSSE